MGVLSKVFKGKESPKPQSPALATGRAPIAKSPAKWEDAWIRKQVAPEEVQQLLHACTLEIKSRGLDMPFMLLPFRPMSDSIAARNFIRNYFRTSAELPTQYQGYPLERELKLTEPLVICSIIKWCWSRLKGGVVTWGTYELFCMGERESNMAKHAFDTFIPLSASSEAHQKIMFDFFDLLAAIAANGKTNGLGGRKLSRFAGWWAFEHSDDDKGFNGGYKSWASAADAASHLFFAYLRALGPDGKPGTSGYSKLPRSLQALLAQTEYPPQTPELLLSRASKVVMLVKAVSPTPFALARRAKNFQYRDEDRILQYFSEYNDPVDALTPECRRVLEAIAANSSPTFRAPEKSTSANPTDASWSRFEDIGFSSYLDESGTNGDPTKPNVSNPNNAQHRATVSTGANAGRPPTPSWADFLSSGFSDDASSRGPSSLLLPPEQILPPLSPSRVQSSQSYLATNNGLREDTLEPGELAGVNYLNIDETFWWVWMTSLAIEEPSERKAVFGRSALLETKITTGRWLVIEEQIKGATVVPDETLFTPEKKGRFSSFTRKGRTRRASFEKRSAVPAIPNQQLNTTTQRSKVVVGANQQAKVQAAAAALVQQQGEQEDTEIIGKRRARTDENADAKTTSVMTLGLQPVLLKEAGPAMQWSRRFDKETVRQKYLGDNMAGKGQFRENSPNASMLNLDTSLSAGDATALAKQKQDEQLGMPAKLETREMPVQKQVPPQEPPPPPLAAKPLPPSFVDPLAATTHSPPAALPVVAPAPAVESTPLLRGASEATPAPTEEAAPVPSTETLRDIPTQQPIVVDRPQTPVKVETAATAPEDESTLVTNTPVTLIDRKPVGSVDSTSRTHPALRRIPAPETRTTPETRKTPDAQKKTEPSTNMSNAAAIAAYRAVSSPQTSPEASQRQATVLSKSKKGSNRGFKGLFGKRKPVPGNASTVSETPLAPRPMNGSALSAEQPRLARTPSFLRRKAAAAEEKQAPANVAPRQEPAVSPAALVPPEQLNASIEGPDSVDIDGGEPGPVVTTDSDEFAEHVPPPVPAMMQPQANESTAQFSNFSQGPEEDNITPNNELEDVPTVHEASPARQFNTRAAQLLIPEPKESAVVQPYSSEQGVLQNDFATSTTESQSVVKETQFISTDDESSPQEASAPQVPVPKKAEEIYPDTSAAERWAEIRKAAATREVSEKSERYRPSATRESQSAETEKTDDGETSGEETIESRVARIKARVAELTGGQNMPTSQSN